MQDEDGSRQGRQDLRAEDQRWAVAEVGTLLFVLGSDPMLKQQFV